jgi:hypothetical protein
MLIEIARKNEAGWDYRPENYSCTGNTTKFVHFLTPNWAGDSLAMVLSGVSI